MTQDIKDIVFTPNEAAKEALATIEERRTQVGVGVRIGIDCLDEYFMPARPGQLITVIGMTSHYKTGFMSFWARQAAEVIKQDEALKQAVVYVTWESAVEELLALDLAATLKMSATDIFQGKITDEQMDNLRAAAFKRGTLPVWIIGHSIKEGRKRPRLTLTVVGEALNYMHEHWGISPRIIFLDYLQQIDTEAGEDRRMQVFNNVKRCKDMSLAMRCPVVVGTQAKRDAYKRPFGIPRVDDSLETSNMEHTTDGMIGVWMPKNNFATGVLLNVPGLPQLEVTDNLLIAKVLKQRMGPSGRAWPLYVDPTKNFIGGMQTEDGAVW